MFSVSLVTSLLALSLPLGLVPGHTAHVVELCVGSHVGQVGQPVGHGEERSDGSDVPGVLPVKAHFLQGQKVLVGDGVAATHGQSKVQHDPLPRGQLCVLIVYNHLGMRANDRGIKQFQCTPVNRSGEDETRDKNVPGQPVWVS